jgi:hypothetical protein
MTGDERQTIRKPQSMDETLALSAAEFRQVDDWLYRGNLSPKRIIKDLVRILDRELAWQGREDSMSLRGLWYSGVKTALQHAFPEKWDDPEFDANRRYSQYLSEYLSDMVTDGEVTYRALNIVDDSRQREIAHGSIEDDKILFVEKEAAYRRLLPIQRVFEVSLVSGGGWEATALIEDMAHHLDPDQSYQLFVLSDYDPTGYEIAEDFERRSKQLGVNITQVDRIGIEPDQVSDHVREQERFQVPVEDDYDERWLREYGIEDRYGLEIEAIGGVGEGGAPLREIVVGAMREHLRFRERITTDEATAVASTAYWSVEHLVDELTDELQSRLLEFACDQMEEADGVTRCYPTDDGTRATIDLDTVRGSDHRLLPRPLDAEEYVECAVDAPTDDEGNTDVVSPSFASQRDRLKQEMYDAIESEDIDVMNLMGLNDE